MAGPSWTPQQARDEVSRLIAPGVLGFYTHFEVTVVFAFPPRYIAPVNVFSIIVAEERISNAIPDPAYLNAERIKSKSLRDWYCGVRRYVRPIAELDGSLDQLSSSREWLLSGERLQIAELAPVPPEFVPPDSTGTVPLNRVLKNNFRNGSHVFEWADPAKTLFKPFFDRSKILQEIADAMRPSVPIALDGLSDRIANVVLQLPVTVLMTKFGQTRASGDFTVTVAWHPKATARPLRATCEKQHDHTISEFMSAVAHGAEASLPMHGGQGLHRGTVWDDQNRVLLAASGELVFIESIALRMQALDAEVPTRVFTVRDGIGGEKEVKVPLAYRGTESIIGQPRKNPTGDWTQLRIYREDAARLAREKRFVQYRPASGQQMAEHEKALKDLRLLMSQYGKEGAWLCDPYLTAHDVLDTLFHCPHPNSDLRALTAVYVPPTDLKEPQEPSARSGCLGTFLPPCLFRRTDAPSIRFAERQRAVFESLTSNLLDLKLEFRVKSGAAGWAFHDRFLIFPVAGRGALAWSLGTSVNSLGKQHHILQQADDGQLIMQAFLDLWNELDQPEYLIWKTP